MRKRQGKKKFIAMILLIFMLLQCMPLAMMAEDEKSGISETKRIASVTTEGTPDAGPEVPEITETKRDTAEKKTGAPAAVIPEDTGEAETDAEASAGQEETEYGSSEAETSGFIDDSGEDGTDMGTPPCSEVYPDNTEGETVETQIPATNESTEASGTEEGTPDMQEGTPEDETPAETPVQQEDIGADSVIEEETSQVPEAIVEDSIDSPTVSLMEGETDSEAPTAPQNLRSTGKTITSISLAWDAATDNVGVVGYQICQDSELLEEITGTSYTATGLQPNTGYTYTVKAVDAAGNLSEASNQLIETTFGILDRPLNLQYSLEDDEVILTWNTVTGASGYKIYRNNQIIGDAVGCTTYTDSTLTENVYYIYEVAAYTSENDLSPKSDPVEVIWSTLPRVYLASDITLGKDTVFDDVDVYLQSGTVDLNGYKLTIDGNLIQSDGTMDINGGTLEVLEDYNIKKTDGAYAYLKMMNEADYVKVWGNFYTNSRYDHSGYLTAGVLEVKGNFTRSDYYYDNFNANGTHKVVLSGADSQIVEFNRSSRDINHFNILEMDTAAQVAFSTPIKVDTLIGIERIDPTSTLDLRITNPLILTSETTTIGTLILTVGTIDIAGKNLVANEIQMKGNDTIINIHEGTITTGSLKQSRGTMDINGGILEVLGDYIIQESFGAYAYLKMVNEADYVKVWGNFYTNSRYDHSGYLTAGVLEIKGNFTQDRSNKSFNTSDTHKVILSGADLQIVQFASIKNNHFNILILTKSFACYQFKQIPCWRHLIQYYDVQSHFGQSGVNPGTGNYSRIFTDFEINASGFDLDITRTYNSLDNRTNTTLGRGWSFSLQSRIEDNEYSDSIKTVRLSNGSIESFVRQTDGSYTAIDSRNKLEFTNDTYIYTTKEQQQYGYDAEGRLIWIKDRNGNTIRISLDSVTGRINTVSDALGRSLTFAYNTAGLLESITDPISRTVTYQYQNQRLVSVTDPMGAVTSYTYAPYTLEGEEDPVFLLSEIRDHDNHLIEAVSYLTEEENRGRIESVTDTYGNIHTYTYDNLNKATTISDSNGRTTVQSYDATFNTTRILDPEGKQTITIYDTNANGASIYREIKAITDRNGNQTIYDRDERGNIIKITNPDSSYKEFTYDDKNNITSEKDEEGKYTFYIYDDAQINLIKKAQPLNGTNEYYEGCASSDFAITQYTYYPAGQGGSNLEGLLQEIIDPEGNITTYTYDTYGNMQSQTDPMGNTTHYTSNAIGWKTKTITPEGYQTTYTYDQQGRLEKQILHDGETTRITYDALGRKTQEVSPNLYDPALDSEHTYNGNHGYRYTYTDSGEIATITDPENNESIYTYDLYGNILTETKPNGAIYLYEYDCLNRLTELSFKENATSAPLVLETYAYAVLAGGRTQKIHSKNLDGNETASTTYIYDYAGRLLEQENPDNSREYFSYYANGQAKTETDPRGSVTTYQYDGLGRLTAQWQPWESNEYIYKESTYDKAGHLLEERIGEEPVALYALPAEYYLTNYTYYDNGLLKFQTDQEGRKTVYTYDADGNLSKEEVYTDAQNKNVTEYTYNHLAKPVTKKQYIKKGDLVGHAFSDTTETTLLTTYTYDLNGNLVTMTTPDGVTTTYTYDHMDRQTSVSQLGQDEEGQAAVLTQTTTYNWEGNTLTITDARANTTTNTYNQRGQLVKTTDALDGVTTFYYDLAGRVIAQVSPANYSEGENLSNLNRVEYTYDQRDRLLTQKDIYRDPETDLEKTITSKTYEYDANGNIISVKDGMGYQTTYTYNLANLVLTELDPVSQARLLTFTNQYQYDTLGRKISEINAKGIETTYTYDQAGNILQIAVDGQTIRTNTYDFTGNLLTQTDGNGNITSYTYNALGKLRQIQYPGDTTIESQTISYQYEVMGNLRREENSQGRIKLYTYDPQGRVLSETQQNNTGGEGITLTYRYDLNGNKCYETDGNGTITAYTYDALNRLHTITTAGKTTTNTYDANNNLLTETDWLGNTYIHIYDPLNRLIEKLNPEGKRIERLVYNNNHVQIESLDAFNNQTTFTYDENNRLLSTTDPFGNSTSQTYDHVGNISSKTDGNGNVTHYTYDEFNRLLSVTNALNETTTYTYDINGNLLTQEDGEGHIIAYRYNVGNKVKEKIDPLNLSESYTYYADGSLKTKTDRNGNTTTYTYDCHGRLTQEAIGIETISYTYDDNDNQLTITDSTGTTTRTYDVFNRVTTKTVPQIGTTTYQYDLTNGLPAGYVAELTTDPKGNTTKKTYDRVGRLQAVTADGATTTNTYFDNGNRASLLYANGAKEEYEYYNNNLLWKLINKNTDGTVMDTYTYTYDQAGNQTSKHEIINGVTMGTTTYTYDDLNRLATVTEPSGKLTTYTYDQAGNRATETITANGETIQNVYAYNAQNRLQSITTSIDGVVTSTTTYAYDDNGNQLTVTTDGVLIATNTYDLWNQLIETVSSDSTIVNTYNGEGLRIAKEVDGVTTYYLYEYDKVILETDDENNMVARNVYGLNLLQRTVGEESYYYLYNGHADVTALIDVASGVIAGTYYYDAFGNILEQTGDVNNSIMYAGYQYDEETGLYYLNARMYDPKIARFLQEDSYTGDINDPLSLNLYTYCANNPITYDDPSGHFLHIAVGGLIGSAISSGMDIATQMILEQKDIKEVNWQSVKVSAVEGGISGGIAAGTGGVSLIATQAGKGAIKQTGKQIAKQTAKTIAVHGTATNALAQQTVKGEIDPREVITSGLLIGLSGGAGSVLPNTKLGKKISTIDNNIKKKTVEVSQDIYSYSRSLVTNERGSVGGKINLWNEYQKLTKGQFATRTEASAAYKASSKGTTKAIKTRYGDASQSTLKEAVELRQYVDNSGQLFRGGKLGRSGAADGQFWAPESPFTPGYANKYGVDFDELNFVIGGRQVSGAPYITRPAPGLGKNTGGALEIVNNPNSVKLDFFHMP